MLKNKRSLVHPTGLLFDYKKVFSDYNRKLPRLRFMLTNYLGKQHGEPILKLDRKKKKPIYSNRFN